MRGKVALFAEKKIYARFKKGIEKELRFQLVYTWTSKAKIYTVFKALYGAWRIRQFSRSIQTDSLMTCFSEAWSPREVMLMPIAGTQTCSMHGRKQDIC